MVEKTTGDSLPEEEVVEEVEQQEGEVAPPELLFAETPLDAIRKEFEGKIEDAKRHFQSVADQQVAAARQQATQAQRRVQDLENELRFTRSKEFESLDPEEQRFRKLEMEMAAMRQGQAQANVPMESRIHPAGVALIYEAGIDPDDTRLDLATDATSFRDGMSRLKASIDKIKEADAAKKEEAVQQSLKEAEERLKAEKPERSTVQVETQGATGRRAKKFEEIEQAWSDGQISPDEYAQARKEVGLE